MININGSLPAGRHGDARGNRHLMQTGTRFRRAWFQHEGLTAAENPVPVAGRPRAAVSCCANTGHGSPPLALISHRVADPVSRYPMTWGLFQSTCTLNSGVIVPHRAGNRMDGTRIPFPVRESIREQRLLIPEKVLKSRNVYEI
mgnify:CR=1 FL=1